MIMTQIVTYEPLIPNAMLEASEHQHKRLCPRQVLGIRMGLLAGKLLNLEVPRPDKRLIVIAETDGCAVDGISAATGCSVGRRTMYIRDWGKVAATFIDCETEAAVRIVPSAGSRQAACDLKPHASSRWHAQLEGYQTLPDQALLSAQAVTLNFSLEQLISQPGHVTFCERCGEEVLNQREVLIGQELLCRSCAGETYYVVMQAGVLPLHHLSAEQSI
jgi:formylmethanofuran dehydrogenase subunit E